MRKLTYYIATTIDGFIAGPGGGDPTGPDGFFAIGQDYIDHIVAEYPETLPGAVRVALGVTAAGTHFDTAVEGRRSYQVGLDAGVTNAYPHLRHLVFSRTMATSPDPTVELIATDPAETVRELKQEAGKGIWLVGGAELAGALYPEIDELILKLNPITVGSGIPMFSPAAAFDPRRYQLVDRTFLETGVAILTYSRA